MTQLPVNFTRSNRLVLAGSLALALALPRSVSACAACFGQSDAPMAKGMNAGIFSLLGVILCVLSAVALFFVHVGRRTASAPPEEPGSSQNPKT